jgi:hypothetical protein
MGDRSRDQGGSVLVGCVRDSWINCLAAAALAAPPCRALAPRTCRTRLPCRACIAARTHARVRALHLRTRRTRIRAHALPRLACAARTRARALPHTRTHARTHTHTHTHAHARTYMRTRTHTHTRTRISPARVVIGVDDLVSDAVHTGCGEDRIRGFSKITQDLENERKNTRQLWLLSPGRDFLDDGRVRVNPSASASG